MSSDVVGQSSHQLKIEDGNWQEAAKNTINKHKGCGIFTTIKKGQHLTSRWMQVVDVDQDQVVFMANSESSWVKECQDISEGKDRSCSFFLGSPKSYLSVSGKYTITNDAGKYKDLESFKIWLKNRKPVLFKVTFTSGVLTQSNPNLLQKTEQLKEDPNLVVADVHRFDHIDAKLFKKGSETSKSS